MGVGGHKKLAVPYCEGTWASVGPADVEPSAFEASLNTVPDKHMKCGT